MTLPQGGNDCFGGFHVGSRLGRRCLGPALVLALATPKQHPGTIHVARRVPFPMNGGRVWLAVGLVALLLSACGHNQQLGTPPVPGGGDVAGRLVSQRSDGSHRAAYAGQRVGVFTQAVFPGPIMQNPPSPIKTAVTAADGTFAFQALEPGRYFITLVGQGQAVQGRWVSVTADRGASVLLVVCTDCAVPL